MKKLLVALMLMMASSSFAAAQIPQLNEADSKDLYNALSKWGTRMVDREERIVRIEVLNPRCIWQKHDQKPHGGCTLFDGLHQIERTRTDKAAWWLTKLLKRHVGTICETGTAENGNCYTAARLIRCWHPWDPKNPPVLVPIGRRYICWLEPIRAPIPTN